MELLNPTLYNFYLNGVFFTVIQIIRLVLQQLLLQKHESQYYYLAKALVAYSAE